MKVGIFSLLLVGLVVGAYRTAQEKMERPLELAALHLGMTVKELDKTFGTPSAQSRNQITYILSDGSELNVTLRDNVISSANVKFNRLIKIQDPEMRKLTLIQMDPHEMENSRPSWFFAGNPADGHIYKITADGRIESMTWVPPFSYHNSRPKHLQALFRDFQSQRVSNL